jgi:hypothetical protein
LAVDQGFGAFAMVLPDVADGGHPGLRELEESADVPGAHAANADAPDGDAITGRDEIAAAENVAGDDRGRESQKLAPSERVHMKRTISR